MVLRMSSPYEVETLDITGHAEITKNIEKMRAALARGDQKAFEVAREEVVRLFRNYGHTKS